MLCDDCTKRIVCKFKEDCNIYERGLNSNSPIGRIFGSKPYCEQKETKPTYHVSGPVTYPVGVRALGPHQIDPQAGFTGVDESISIITTTNNSDGEYSIHEDHMPIPKNIQVYNINEVTDKIRRSIK